LQRTESFGFVLVTHDLKLAKRARRCFEMRQGALAATDLPQVQPSLKPSRDGASSLPPSR
jgi:ABC-type lipoprotein export system ATPase subunit